ncbi:hypothetical protein [Paenibacillus sp. MMS18-CY102]|uniref:hypothetical protein n=1 Tax=Paenibacillus sp. MMS18-CY102 TaxID=2682849 RepID=UPI001366679B|nr:hypothetical protein [Paenibacillus sp. MMS18-CY102]MWC29983.1 hypothetical protein [Paenibacillus sp. MMS18-CY102]
MKKWKSWAAVMLAGIWMLSGCSQPTEDTHITSSPVKPQLIQPSEGTVVTTVTSPLAANANGSPAISPSGVQWVYMSWPIPSQYVSSPLIGGRDDTRISQLLQWVEQAKRVDGKGLSAPLHGRSMAVNIEFSPERKIVIRPAWTCDSSKDAKGNTRTSCKPVDSRVWIEGTEGEPYFAQSDTLYAFVNKGYLDWMPNVNPYEAPSQLPIGGPFTIRGHGARTGQVTVALMKGNSTLWVQPVSVKEGEWLLEGQVSDQLSAGDYEWKINTGITTFLQPIHCERTNLNR